MTTYLDQLPTDISNLIYQKKFNLELIDELKNYSFNHYNSPKFKPINLKIGQKISFYKDGKGKLTGEITRMTKCYVFLTLTTERYRGEEGRVKKCDSLRYYPDKIRTGFTKKTYWEDSGSVWYKPNPIREKYFEYLSDRTVNRITEMNMRDMMGYRNPMISMDNPYITLYLEVYRPELGVVWDRQLHPDFMG